MKINSIALASMLATGLWLTSCTGKLDIKPITNVSSGQALSTASDLNALLVGAYNAIGSVNVYGGDLQRDAELLGDNGEVTWTGTFTEPQQMYTKRLLINNRQVDLTWTDAYQAINIANTVLANLSLAASADRNRIEGEAKFIRASMYFELVRVYAKTWGDGDNNANLGVPIVLTPTTSIDASNNVARSTVAAVYTQIIQDLVDAEAKLPATNGFFATKGAAAAQASRVYLQKLDYTNAAAAANRVIAGGQYELAELSEQAFDLRINVSGGNTSETIFAIQITDQDGTNDLNTFYSASEYGGRGDIEITDKHLALYDATDDRLGRLFYQDEIGAVRTAKFVNQYGNIQIFRLAEMYLTRAEANFRAGTTVGATPLADINTIRTRAGATALTSAQLTAAAILLERRLELAFEGTLLHDVKRTRQSIVAGTTTVPWNSTRLIYPIPLREITTNPALLQNAGY
jgi:hypothetical protein